MVMVIYKIYETFMYTVIHVATPSTFIPEVKFLFLNLYKPSGLDNHHSLMLQLKFSHIHRVVNLAITTNKNIDEVVK